MTSMQQQLGMLGTISAFAYRHREKKKILCRVGRSQDFPDNDFQPAIRQIKYYTVNSKVSVKMYFNANHSKPTGYYK